MLVAKNESNTCLLCVPLILSKDQNVRVQAREAQIKRPIRQLFLIKYLYERREKGGKAENFSPLWKFPLLLVNNIKEKKTEKNFSSSKPRPAGK